MEIDAHLTKVIYTLNSFLTQVTGFLSQGVLCLQQPLLHALPALSFLLSSAFTLASPAQDPSMAPTALRNNLWILAYSPGQAYSH